jgi:hypothetical protein
MRMSSAPLTVRHISDRDWPPSTFQQAPVTRLERGEAKVTTSATSCGVPKRPMGISPRRGDSHLSQLEEGGEVAFHIS